MYSLGSLSLRWILALLTQVYLVSVAQGLLSFPDLEFTTVVAEWHGVYMGRVWVWYKTLLSSECHLAILPCIRLISYDPHVVPSATLFDIEVFNPWQTLCTGLAVGQTTSTQTFFPIQRNISDMETRVLLSLERQNCHSIWSQDDYPIVRGSV